MHAQRTVCTTQLSRSNIVIGVVLGEVLVARVVPLVVDAVISLALSLIAHVVVVVSVVAILHRIFLYGRYTLHILSPANSTCPRLELNGARNSQVTNPRTGGRHPQTEQEKVTGTTCWKVREAVVRHQPILWRFNPVEPTQPVQPANYDT